MSRFGLETPMDFEFQNGTGNIDPRSPFAQVSSKSQKYGTPATGATKKRTYSSFDSPSKGFARMGGQSSSPSKQAWNNPLFTTPRKSRDEIDDSSAGETPKNDSDATPDTLNLRSALNRFDAQSAPILPTPSKRETQSPTKERPAVRRDSSFTSNMLVKVKKMWSPGRGEIVKRNHNPDGVDKSVMKRRRRQVDRRVVRNRRHSMSGSEADSDYRPAASPRKGSSQNPGQPEPEKSYWLPSFFRFIASQPMLPHILSWYAQLMFNIFLLCFCGYIIYSVWTAVQGDIDRNSYDEYTRILAEIATCIQDYEKNKCDPPEARLPALQQVCSNWKLCMERDATKVARARVSAATFAGIYNSFVEEISWKAIAFTFIITVGTFSFGNLAFGVFRSKAEQYQHIHPQWQQPPPPTPQRSFNSQDGGFYTGTPWHQPPSGALFEPQPSGGYGEIEGKGSPVRRLAYN